MPLYSSFFISLIIQASQKYFCLQCFFNIWLLLSSHLITGYWWSCRSSRSPRSPWSPCKSFTDSVIHLDSTLMIEWLTKLLCLCPVSCRVLKVLREPRVHLWVYSVFLKAYCHCVVLDLSWITCIYSCFSQGPAGAKGDTGTIGPPGPPVSI